MEHPPYSYSDSNNSGVAAGITIDIVEAAFALSDITLEIEVVPWTRALHELKTGKVEGLFPALKNTEREKFANYSDILIEEVVSLFMPAGHNITFEGNLSNLRGHSIGAIRDYYYGSKFERVRNSNLFSHIYYVINGRVAIPMLTQRRFDLFISDRLVAIYHAKQLHLQDKISELKPALEVTPTYIMFAKTKRLQLVGEQINRALLQMKQNGSYDKIISRWTSQSRKIEKKANAQN